MKQLKLKSLDCRVEDGYTTEKNGRKDRIISMIYGLYFINQLEEDLIAVNKSVNISDYVSSKNYSKKGGAINPFASNIKKLAGFGMRR